MSYMNPICSIIDGPCPQPGTIWDYCELKKLQKEFKERSEMLEIEYSNEVKYDEELHQH